MKKLSVMLAAALLIASALPVKETHNSAWNTGIQAKGSAPVDVMKQRGCDSGFACTEGESGENTWMIETLKAIGYSGIWPALCLSSICHLIPDPHPLKDSLMNDYDDHQEKKHVPERLLHFEQPGLLSGVIGES